MCLITGDEQVLTKYVSVWGVESHFDKLPIKKVDMFIKWTY